MKIDGFIDYTYCKDNESVMLNSVTISKIKRPYGKISFRMKNDSGEWKHVGLGKIKSILSLGIKVPSTAVVVPYTDSKYYVDINGDIYSFNNKPEGAMLVHRISTKGYPTVRIKIKNKIVTKEVHSVMCMSFYDKDYIDKKLCCLHNDDNKLNCNISNLSIGTYSKNNSGAYKNGLNKGNGLKKSL